MQPDFLLSDKFEEFTIKINVLRERKKEKLIDFKKLYEEHKIDLKNIEEEVSVLQKEYLLN